MSEKAYKIVDRRYSAGGSDKLIQASTQNNKRKRVESLDYDFDRNVSSFGRKELMNQGRKLFMNCGPVRAALLEMATYASMTFVPQFYGANKEWGKSAKDWLYEWHKRCDIKGFPYGNIAIYRRNLILGVVRDGDMGTILTEKNGHPQLQVIPAHRISSGSNYENHKNLIDGVFVDEYGAATAYRVNNQDNGTFRDIPTDGMFLSFIPEWPEQYRGVSGLSFSIFQWADFDESQRAELQAQKLASFIAMQEKNEQGAIDATKAQLAIYQESDATTTPNTPAIYSQNYEEGMVKLFKAGTGSGLESFVSDRPTVNQRAFQENVSMCNLAGLFWSFFFTLDQSKIGGASMRVVLEKIDRTIKFFQDTLLEPAERRADLFAIAMAIQRGELPFDKEWFKWFFIGGGGLTADKKYDADVNIALNQAGLSTLAEITSKSGSFWEDVQDQLIEEARRLKEKCEEAGVDISMVKLGKQQPQQPQQEKDKPPVEENKPEENKEENK